MEWVPQLPPSDGSGFDSAEGSAKGGSMLFWNEPDINGWYVSLLSLDESMNERPREEAPARRSVSDAVTAWNQYFQSYAGKGCSLGSPAVTSSITSGQGLSWLSSFMSACTGCTVHNVAVHWYDVSFADFTGFINKVRPCVFWR